MRDQTTYAEKVKGRRWQKKRLKIFERDEWNCQQCHSKETKTLHVHHRRYLPNTEPWDYPDKLLVTLCETCHQLETDEMPHALDMLRTIVQDAWLADDIRLHAVSLGSALEDPAVNSDLILPVVYAVLTHPLFRRATLRAYIETFSPVEPFLSRLRAQIDSDSKYIDEHSSESRQ